MRVNAPAKIHSWTPVCKLARRPAKAGTLSPTLRSFLLSQASSVASIHMFVAVTTISKESHEIANWQSERLGRKSEMARATP
jgi:hypothetical protein